MEDSLFQIKKKNVILWDTSQNHDTLTYKYARKDRNYDKAEIWDQNN